METGKVIRKYKGHMSIIHDVAMPRKTRDIISSVADDGMVKIWEQRSKKEVRTFE